MSYAITSYFGQREGFRQSNHTGVDFAFPKDTPLRSIRDGYVEKVVDYGNQNIGKGVLIKFEDGRTAIYGHMSKTTIQPGANVKAGDLIGYSGNSGNVVGENGGYHLHFGIKEDGKFINPSDYIEDIKHMNEKRYFVQDTQFVKVNFFDYIKEHTNLNFINFLPDNVQPIQLVQKSFKFLSGESSLLQIIIACIF